MNVIVANKYQSMLEGLNIDVIKTMYGEYDVEEIIASFKNFYFQRMILDITSIKNYKDIKNLQKLSIALDMDKVILLLDDDPKSTESGYLSKLISMGIYNFTKNTEGILYLYEHPNTYRDVAQYQQLDDTPVVSPQAMMSPTGEIISTRIIGVKNVNSQAGATTFIYMMKKQLEQHYSVTAVEVDRHDFSYFNDKNMITTTNKDFDSAIAKLKNQDIILVDVDNSINAIDACTEVYYLLEPSVIKLNKLMMIDPRALSKYKDKKIILNQSLLSKKDVLDFEYESKLKIFYNMPPLDDREHEIQAMNAFLIKIGFNLQVSEEAEKKKNILGLFGL